MEKIINFRPLAEGMTNKNKLTIKTNSMLRSGILAMASDLDKKSLNQLGVKTIYDLRSESEYKQMPALTGDFTTKHFHILDDMDPNVAAEFTRANSVDIIKWMDKLYAEDFAGKDPFVEVVASILKHQGEAFMFHCTAGRDRTGTLGAIIMMILDFDVETIINEYLKYDPSGSEMLAQMTLKNIQSHGIDGDIEALRALFKPAKSNIEAFLNVILMRFDSFDSYLLDVYSIDKKTKENFQSLYLS